MVSHDISTLQGADVSTANLINSLPEVASVFGDIFFLNLFLSLLGNSEILRGHG